MAKKQAGNRPRPRARNGEGNLRQLPSGLWEVSVAGPKGGPRRLYATGLRTEQGAILRKAELQIMAKRGPYVINSKQTVADVFEAFSRKRRSEGKAPSKSREDTRIAETVWGELGDMRVTELEPLRIQSIVTGLLDKPRSLSTKTVGGYLSFLRLALDWSVVMRWSSYNPAASINLMRGRRIEEDLVISVEEVRRVIRACAGTDIELVVLIMAHTGLRIGEVMGLWVDDLVLDVAEPRLHVRRSLRYASDLDESHYWATTKSPSSKRVVEIDDILAARLVEERDKRVRQVGGEGLHGYVDAAHTYVRRKEDASEVPGVVDKFTPYQVCARSDCYLRKVSSVQYRFRGVMRKNELEFHPHLFRHSYASLYDSGETNKAVTQKMLGHSSTQQTDVYTHPLAGEPRHRAQIVGKLLSGDVGMDV